MRIVSKSALRAFWAKYPGAEKSLDIWYRLVKGADYRTPKAVKAAHASASFLPADHVVFNVGGNNYRVLVRFAYRFGIVYIRRVMTHAEYTKLTDAGTLIPQKRER